MTKHSSKSGPRKQAPRSARRTKKKVAAVRAPKPVKVHELAAIKPSKDAGPVSPSELSNEVMEFINAIDTYKRLNRRPFPSWSEIFEIVKALGYHKSA